MKSVVFLIALLAVGLLVTSSAFAIDVKPTGRIYANFNYNLSGYPDWDDRAADNDFASFDLARAYLGVAATFSPQWSALIVGDIARFDQVDVEPIYDEDTGELIDVEVTKKKSPYFYYAKYAFGQYMPFASFGMRMGIMNTPYIDQYEKAWGYRYIEKTPSDRVKWDSSADAGFAFLGDLPGNYGSYSVMIRNGEGYKKPEGDSGKAGQVRIRLTPFQMSEYSKNLQLLGSYRYERVTRQNPEVTSRMFNGLLSYKAMFNRGFGLNFGAGYDWMSTAVDIKGEETIVSTIAHGYGVIYFPYGLAIFGRADLYDPDTENDKNTHGYQDEEMYVLGGVSVDPVKNISVALDVKRTSYTAEVVDDKGKDVTMAPDTVLYVHTRFKF